MADRRLLLLRHAKSSWGDPGLADHDRPLAPRGRKAAALIAEHLRGQKIPVSLTLCSSARRARETVELVSPAGAIRIEPGIYGASADELLERLRRVSDEVEVAMVVGHNPTIEDLAIALTRGADELAGRKFPTGVLVTLSFAGPWRTLGTQPAELVAFVTPKQLG